MKHKEKQPEYARQYQTMSAKERRKEIQFRRPRWLSEELSRKIFSREELLNKA